jgi:hypothetical protein
MKAKNLIILSGLVCLIALSISCTKANLDDDFPPGDVPPVAGGYTAADQVAAANLVTKMSFEGNLSDSISKTNATAYGTTFSKGIKGQGLSVGLNHYALFTPTAAIKSLQSMTISFWVNTPQNTTGIQTPISFVHPTEFWGNLDMFFDGQTPSSSIFKMHLWGSGGTKEAWLASWSISNPWSSWQHITLSYNMETSTFSFYVNGSLVGTSVQSGFGSPNFANLSNIVIGTVQFMTTPSLTSGATSQSWASYVLGSIDELRIYNKGLTAIEASALAILERRGQ